MTRARPSTTLFEDAIDVPLWLEADRNTPYEARLARDRDIARNITSTKPVARIRAWWRLLQRDHESEVGLRLLRSRQLVTLVMALIGAGTGSAVALAAFHYDGT